jgi:hypothetical protein
MDDGRGDVDQIRRLRQEPEADHEAERRGEGRAAEALGAEHDPEGQRDDRGERQVELEVQQREHHEGRGAEQERREQPRALIPQDAADTEDGRHSQREEGQHDRLGGQGHDGEDEVEGAGRAGHQGWVEGRVAGDRRPELALGEAPMAAQGALEVIGVVPLGRAAIDAHPDGRHRDENEEDGGEPEPGAPAHLGRVPGLSRRRIGGCQSVCIATV